MVSIRPIHSADGGTLTGLLQKTAAEPFNAELCKLRSFASCTEHPFSESTCPACLQPNYRVPMLKKNHHETGANGPFGCIFMIEY